jgi:hypothetical protein
MNDEVKATYLYLIVHRSYFRVLLRAPFVAGAGNLITVCEAAR